jgi:hypothetical protein
MTIIWAENRPSGQSGGLAPAGDPGSIVGGDDLYTFGCINPQLYLIHVYSK